MLYIFLTHTYIYFTDKEILPKEAKDTADVLLFFDKLFDSMNGSFSKNKNAKELLGPVRPNSGHHKFWADAKIMLKNMKFVNKKGKDVSVPSINNWVWTLDGLETLVKKLQHENHITSLWMRHLNQDPIENFFGEIRSHGCRNNNPTPQQFESAFITNLINGLTSVHTFSGNCEKDFCTSLYVLASEDCNPKSSQEIEIDFNKIMNIEFTALEAKSDPRILGPLQYISGYFIRQSKKKVFKNCPSCNESLITNDQIEYIKYREYKGRRWLCNPHSNVILLISKMQDIINEILKNDLYINNLKEMIKTVIMVLIDFNFLNCTVHRDKFYDFLINLVIRFLIFNYCKNLNRILIGKKPVDDDEDVMQRKAKIYFNKCFKRKL